MIVSGLAPSHNDLALKLREKYANDLRKINLKNYQGSLGFHTDMSRLKNGLVGAQVSLLRSRKRLCYTSSFEHPCCARRFV